MRRSLTFFWRTNLAVALGAAVTTAVMTGALLVGDSVRESLRQLTLDRLGAIDYALVSPRFFRERLGQDLTEQSLKLDRGFGPVAPMIVLGGSASHPVSGTRASQVNILGVDPRFLSFFDASASLERRLGDLSSPGLASVVINQSLQKELRVQAGETLLVAFETSNDVHRELLFGRRESSQVVRRLRAQIRQVIPDRGPGRFGLRPHQNLPFNVLVPLPLLQRTLRQEGRVNALMVAGHPFAAENGALRLEDELRQFLTLEDFGLLFHQRDGHLTVESRELVLRPWMEEAVRAAAQAEHLVLQPVLTYLANEMLVGQKTVPYSTVASLQLSQPSDPISLSLTTGESAPVLTGQQILLNQWAARELNASVGDSLQLTYYSVGPLAKLQSKVATFQLEGVVQMKGLGADADLTPEIPGIQEAPDMSSWNPPFPVDFSRIRPQDEAYWDEYRAAPKAFVALETGQRLWETRFGRLTSFRVTATREPDWPSTRADLEKAILERLSPEQLGFRFQAVKREGLQAASGATDFGMLFIGFSSFLILSGALLVGLLFRLGVEQRASELGLLLALGYSPAQVRRRFLAEGILLAAGGAILGLAAAAGYGWLLIAGLRTWWSDAIGHSFLELHVGGVSLALGFLISILVVIVSIWWAVRHTARFPIPELLTGGRGLPRRRGSAIWAKRLGVASTAVCLALGFFAWQADRSASVGLFFGLGTALLTAGLCFFALWLRVPSRRLLRPGDPGLTFRFAARNSSRNPGRSLLIAALLASACFVIVAVAASRHEPDLELAKESGTGGYALLAEADIPIYQNLNAPQGRFQLGFSESDSRHFQGSTLLPFRLLPGEDASCLNLYRPTRPRLLGVPSSQVSRGGFRFSQVMEEVENPWTLLEKSLEPDVVPAFGDANSVIWILHSGLGQDFIIQDERGEPLRLRFVGLLSGSVFQGEMLISEANFVKHFPSQGGHSYFLVETPPGSDLELASLLENRLGEYGFDVTSTRDRLAGYLAVENTYLSTFQTLGGLGLLLGTLGLGVVLVRNVLERRGELATLRAIGFERSKLAWMVLTENAFLLVLGLAVGSLSALAAVSPHLLARGGSFPWLSLSLTLLVVVVTGLAAGAVAVWNVLQIPLLPALKAE